MGALIGSVSGALKGFLLAPVFLAFLALIPVVILLYLLKLRRTEVIISSTMLWLKNLQDLTANAPFQKLRWNLLLILQILVLLFAIFALARPYYRSEGVSGNNLCILLDRSASMQTKESDGTRLEEAKAKALEMIDDLGRGDKAMVVAFAENADVLCELSDDRRALRQAVQSVQASDCRTRIRDAVSVAHSLQLNVPDLKIAVISDGNISDLDEIGTRALDPVFVRVGDSAYNLGIAGFSLREPAEGETERQVLVHVHNEYKDPETTTLTLSFEGSDLAVEEVSLKPNADQDVVFALPSLEGAGILKAKLDCNDRLTVDNTAWLALRPTSTIKVLIVAEPDSTSAYFLKKALTLESRVELSAVPPASYVPTPDYALTFFVSFAPDSIDKLPGGTLVFVNSLPPLPGISRNGDLEKPPVVAKDPEHPTMRFLNPSNLTVEKAMKVILPEGSKSLISTEGAALVADISRGDQRVLLLAFDIADSNWPIRLSFPLFLQNILNWLPKGPNEKDASVPTGRPLTILPKENTQTASVIPPLGSAVEVALDPLRPVFFGATDRAGPYLVTRGDEKDVYAVNLLDGNESAITPAEKLQVGRAEIQALTGPVKQNREMWHWFLLAAFLLLTLEWWVYTRRAWL